MDPPLLDAFGFPAPPRWLRGVMEGALKMRARAIRLLPKRTFPHFVTKQPNRTYPNGYELEALGPPSPPPDTPEERTGTRGG